MTSAHDQYYDQDRYNGQWEVEMGVGTSYKRQAYELGVEHAKNAASWVLDGNAGGDHYRRLLTIMDEGDPALYDSLPREPNLSGEFADDLTPEKLFDEIVGDDECDADETLDAICDAYEQGVSDTFQSECERLVREALA